MGKRESPLRHLMINTKTGQLVMPKRDLECRYCNRKFVWTRSRTAHETRCPSKVKIPNCIEFYRKSLQHVKSRLELALKADKPMSDAQIKRLITFVSDSIKERP